MSDEELIQALKTALEATPTAVPLHTHLADLLMQNGRYAEAVDVYRQALDLAPDDNEIKHALAKAYQQQGKPSVALVVLEQLMREEAITPEGYILAVRAYLDIGNPASGSRAYQSAIAENPALADEDLESQLSAVPIEEPVGETSEPNKDDLVFVTVDDEAAAVDMDLERPQVTFKDVGGMEKLKEEIRMKIIYPLTHPEIYEAYGKKMGGGILMYGPPGCGKTHLARATAGEVNAHFLAIGLHDVLDMYLGQSEQNLHAIFELARSNTPCVLFFDEVDALGAKRSDMRYSAGRHVINQFLAELDGVNTSNEGVLILAATNAPWHLDSAMRRPGRFDRVIFVPPPDRQARALILEIMLNDKPKATIAYDRLAKQTAGFSGADLKGMVDMAVEQKLRAAMRKGIPEPLSTDDIQRIMKTIQPTTTEWFETARNYAIYSNQSGLYDDILDYLQHHGNIRRRRR